MQNSPKSYSSQRLFQSVKNSDNKIAKSMSQNIIQQIQDIVDTQNNTLLHVATNNNNNQMVQYYLGLYNQLIKKKPKQYTEQTRAKWLRIVDREGFTCLHYAVFRGNYQLAVLLQQNGADIHQVNHQGLTVLHIAAQGDSPLLINYFLKKGIKIGVEDLKGSTPLHWACYSGMQSAAQALIAWGAEIDKIQKTFGMTPLHLAVMSGNGRIVKKLLLKGCDRNIKSINNKSPLQIARQNQYKNIAQMIENKQGIQQILNIKTPFKKLKKHTFPFYLFIFLFLTDFVFNIVFSFQQKITNQKAMSITFLVLGIIVAILMIICKLSNPGFLKPFIPLNLTQILLKNKPNEICYDCGIVKPSRSRHCQICNCCICVYDHHCPWVANCVGAKNYWIFFTFLLSMIVFMSYAIAFQIANLSLENWEIIKPFAVIQIICSIYSLTISFIFIFPLFFLLFVQTQNMLLNKTTFQRYSSEQSQSRAARRSQSENSIYQSVSIKSKLLSRQSQLDLPKPLQIQSKLPPQKIKNLHNCYQMCYGNSQNKQYQDIM